MVDGDKEEAEEDEEEEKQRRQFLENPGQVSPGKQIWKHSLTRSPQKALSPEVPTEERRPEPGCQRLSPMQGKSK